MFVTRSAPGRACIDDTSHILSLDDLPIQPALAHPLSPAAPRLLHDLLSARSAGRRHEALGAAVHELGFDRLIYTRLQIVTGRPLTSSVHTCVGDGDWSRHYSASNFLSVDPRLPQALASTLPTRWDLESLRYAATDDPEGLLTFLGAMHDAGLRSGAVFAIRGPAPGERSVMSLSTQAHTHAVPDDTLIGNILMLGLAVHEFFIACYQQQRAPASVAPIIGAQQVRILQGLARGLTDREIAEDLALSRHGVDYHLRQLRKGFNARNRVELVQAALGVRKV